MAKARSTSPAKGKASPAKAKSPSPAKPTTRSSPRKATSSTKVKDAETTDKVKTGRVAKASPGKASSAKKAATKTSPAKKSATKASPAKTTPSARATRSAASKSPTSANKSSPARKSSSPAKSTAKKAAKSKAKSPAKFTIKGPINSPSSLLPKSPGTSPGRPRGRPPKKVSPAKDAQFSCCPAERGEFVQLDAKSLAFHHRQLKHAISVVNQSLATGAIDIGAFTAAWDILHCFPQLMGYASQSDPKVLEMKAEYRQLMDILMPGFCDQGSSVQVLYHGPPWNSLQDRATQAYHDGMDQYAQGMQQYHQGMDQFGRAMQEAFGSGLTPDLDELSIDSMFSPTARSFFDSATSDSSGQPLVSPTAKPTGRGRGRGPAKTRAASSAKPSTKVASGRVTKAGRGGSRSPVKNLTPPPSPGSGLAYTRSKSPAKKMARSPSKSPAPVARGSQPKSPTKAAAETRSRSKSPAKTKATSRSKSPAKQLRLLPDTNTDIFDSNNTESNRRPRNVAAQPAFGQASLPGGFSALPASAARRNLSGKSKQAGKQSTAPSPKASATKVANERGTVISTTNPEYIKGTKRLNPFFETLPGPEIWHRRMPPYFPFGETPYMEAVMSKQIDEDLARGLKDEKTAAANDKSAAVNRKGITGRLASGATSGATAVSAWFSRRLSSPSPSEPAVKYPPMWDLPTVTQKEIDEAIESYSFSYSAGKKSQGRKRSSR